MICMTGSRLTGTRSTGVWSALARVALAAAVLCLASLQAQASAPQAWTVESQSGQVQLVKSGISPIALTPGDVFDGGDWIETGPDGRALLRRGEETIVVAPNSRIGLPNGQSGAITTRILQTLGTILLTVEKKAKQHFAVETPYLIAVVKGTTFTVSVDGGRSNVHVVEGLVEVKNQASGRSVLVHPGQIGSVLRNGAGDVELEGAAEPQGTPDSGSTTRADNGAGNGKANAAQNRGQATKVRIAETLGNQPLDLTNSTKGLVRAASVAAPQANLGKGAERSANAGAAPLTGSGVQSAALGNGNGLAVGKGVSANPGLTSSNGLAVGQDLSVNPGLGGGSGLVAGNGLTVNPELGNGLGVDVGQGLNVNPGLGNGLGNGNGLGVGQGLKENPGKGSK